MADRQRFRIEQPSHQEKDVQDFTLRYPEFLFRKTAGVGNQDPSARPISWAWYGEHGLINYPLLDSPDD